MNYLGIDYGESKIGLAKASEEIRLALPFKIIFNTKNLIEDLEKIILEESITRIIVGYPITLKGEVGNAAKLVDDFIQKISVFSLPIERQDERFSTKSSFTYSKKEKDDSSAATLILQTYLDSLS
jgi:putative holliday junction resolvase